LEDAFKADKFNAVIHTACSYGRNKEPVHKIAETNLLFSLRLLDAAITFNTDTFFSTDTILPKYLNSYSLSKRQFTEWLKQRSSEIQVINMKLEHLYGPKDDTTKFVPRLVEQLLQGAERIPLTEGHQLRDFIYIEDAVSAYQIALNKAEQLEKLNEFDVGAGKLIKVNEFVQQIYAAVQKQHPEIKTTLGFGDIPLREGELMSVELDTASLINIGWKVKHSIQDGIKKTIEAMI